MHLLHVTCLPTLQLQRCEEYYGALLHELHAEVRRAGSRGRGIGLPADPGQGLGAATVCADAAGSLGLGLHPLRPAAAACLLLLRAQKAAAVRKAAEMEEAREGAMLEARRWQHQAEELEAQVQLLEAAEGSRPAPPPHATPVAASLPEGTPAEQDSAVQQLAVLQEQLECLAEGGLPALQQERARMSICLQTIKVGGSGRGPSPPPLHSAPGAPLPSVPAPPPPLHHPPTGYY